MMMMMYKELVYISKRCFCFALCVFVLRFFLFFLVQTPADRVRLKHLEGEKE